MFYNYQEIIVVMLLLPVALNIVLPLAMLVVWLFKQLVVGKKSMKKLFISARKAGFPSPPPEGWTKVTLPW